MWPQMGDSIVTIDTIVLGTGGTLSHLESDDLSEGGLGLEQISCLFSENISQKCYCEFCQQLQLLLIMLLFPSGHSGWTGSPRT